MKYPLSEEADYHMLIAEDQRSYQLTILSDVHSFHSRLVTLNNEEVKNFINITVNNNFKKRYQSFRRKCCEALSIFAVPLSEAFSTFSIYTLPFLNKNL